MTTIAERIVAISGLPTGTVTVHLLAFPGSSGSTVADRIRTRSMLPSATVAAHLMDAGGGSAPADGGFVLIWRRRRRM